MTIRQLTLCRNLALSVVAGFMLVALTQCAQPVHAREYPATVVRVLDGDTVECSISLGFGLTLRESVRLAGIDAPEMNTAAGKESRAALCDLLPIASSVVVVTGSQDRDKYGRILADLRSQGKSVVRIQIQNKQGIPYDGGKR